MIGIGFLGIALLMVFIEIENLKANGRRPWGRKKAPVRRKTKYQTIRPDWDRIQEETKLQKPKRKTA